MNNVILLVVHLAERPYMTYRRWGIWCANQGLLAADSVLLSRLFSTTESTSVGQQHCQGDQKFTDDQDLITSSQVCWCTVCWSHYQAQYLLSIADKKAISGISLPFTSVDPVRILLQTGVCFVVIPSTRVFLQHQKLTYFLSSRGLSGSVTYIEIIIKHPRYMMWNFLESYHALYTAPT